MVGCVTVCATVHITVNEDIPIITYTICLNCQWEFFTYRKLYFLKMFLENLEPEFPPALCQRMIREIVCLSIYLKQ